MYFYVCVLVGVFEAVVSVPSEEGACTQVAASSVSFYPVIVIDSEAVAWGQTALLRWYHHAHRHRSTKTYRFCTRTAYGAAFKIFFRLP